MRVAGWVVVLSSALLWSGCQAAPRPLVAGTDACEYCRMTISDVRFGGEIQLATGRIHTFDAIECLASYYLDATRSDVKGVWVSDFTTRTLVPVDSATFVSGGLNSPMGRSLVAFGTPGDAQTNLRGGRLLRWPDVLELMRVRGLEPGATSADTAAGHGSTR